MAGGKIVVDRAPGRICIVGVRGVEAAAAGKAGQIGGGCSQHQACNVTPPHLSQPASQPAQAAACLPLAALHHPAGIHIVCGGCEPGEAAGLFLGSR